MRMLTRGAGSLFGLSFSTTSRSLLLAPCANATPSSQAGPELPQTIASTNQSSTQQHSSNPPSSPFQHSSPARNHTPPYRSHPQNYDTSDRQSSHSVQTPVSKGTRARGMTGGLSNMRQLCRRRVRGRIGWRGSIGGRKLRGGRYWFVSMAVEGQEWNGMRG